MAWLTSQTKLPSNTLKATICRYVVLAQFYDEYYCWSIQPVLASWRYLDRVMRPLNNTVTDIHVMGRPCKVHTVLCACITRSFAHRIIESSAPEPECAEPGPVKSRPPPPCPQRAPARQHVRPFCSGTTPRWSG